ncbi:hypothetical protein [Alteriqipengyuania sp. 357]
MAVRFAPFALALVGAVMLTACSAQEEKTYEVDATDESGGELIVADENPEGVAVDLPETEMTNVPPEEQAGAMGDKGNGDAADAAE